MIKKSLRMAGLVVVAAVAAVGVASAHLTANSLLPKGGESLTAGKEVSITWNVSVLHDGKTDIALSKDAGKTWTTLKKGFQASSGDNTFKWTPAADDATSAGKIRVCLGAGTDCTTENTSSPSAPPYRLVSGTITVQSSSAVAARNDFAGDASINFNALTRNVDVSFGLTESKDVQLQAFDTQGRLLATLVQGAFAAGNHKLSLFSNRLDISGGSLIFKLKVGDQVQSHTWTMVR